jgi:hypothetical protein
VTRHDQHAEISPGLPILAELGDALIRDVVRQERSRRRGAIGALAGTLAALVATTVALAGDDIDQARAVHGEAGHTAHATWQLALADPDDAPCLQLRPRSQARPGSTTATPRARR